MPALYVFDRRLSIGGDDVQPGCMVIIGIRLIELLLLIPVILEVIGGIVEHGLVDYLLYPPSSSSECRNAYYYALFQFIFCISTLVFILWSIVLECRMIHYSSIGTPTQPEVRKNVSCLMEMKFVPLNILEALVCSLGITTLCYLHRYYYCVALDKDEENSFSLIRTMMVHWAYFLGLFGLILIRFVDVVLMAMSTIHLLRLPKTGDQQQRSLSLEEQMENSNSLHEHAYYGPVEDMWTERCLSCCKCSAFATCSLFGGKHLSSNELYGTIARVLTDYFEHGGVLDVVPSDIIAGFVMLQRLQKARQYEARRVLKKIMDRDREKTPLVATSSSSSTSSAAKRSASITRLMSFGSTRTDDTSAPPVQLAHSFRPTTLMLIEDDIYNASHDRPCMAFRLRERSGTHQFGASKRITLSPTHKEDVDVMTEASRYVRFALSIYSWMLYIYMKPCRGSCRLAWASCCGHHKSSCQNNTDNASCGSPTQDDCISPLNANHHSQTIHGDNCFNAHFNAFLLHNAKIDSADVVYASFQSGIAETPYAIVLDHRWKSVVLTIRGSLTLEDCVVDVLVDPAPLHELGLECGFDGTDEYCHHGVLTCALWIKQDLDRHAILDSLLNPLSGQYPGYTLRITGHSLGAGCATLLSFMYKSTYPTLRCICYSPPGGFLTWKSATSCKDYVTSFVLDSDLVPRLSVENMERLRDEVLNLVGRIRVPKMEVLQSLLSGFSSLLFLTYSSNVADIENREEKLLQSNDKMLYAKDQMPTDTPFYHQLQQFRNIQKERKEHRNIVQVSLYPPGTIIHLVKTGELRNQTCDCCCCCRCPRSVVKCLTCGMTNVGSEYTPIYVENDDFNEIVISPTMATDHFPDRVGAEIEKVAAGFCQADNSIRSLL